ncbi:hypothetical protein HZB08_00355 [Candidatus Saganbacteria bacterium]|uniref:Uncharacterized protein n=1 Tax=Candidatus Saganbacteria bacterium TaxID=2575572 RepID=A0A9D6UJE8_UNCSA|nr:hypothetical protein [Candidatus Saganbacteria bacterium]
MKRERIILIVLMVVALAYALYTYWPILSPYLRGAQKVKPAVVAVAPGAGKTPATLTQTPTTAAVPPALVETKEAEEAAPVLSGAKLTDPFSLRVAVQKKEASSKPEEQAPPPEAPPEPKLEGIWMDSGMKVAFISGQALGVGGAVMGWEVKEISNNRVVLQKGSATKILEMEGK